MMTSFDKRLSAALRALPELPSLPAVDWHDWAKRLGSALGLKFEILESVEKWHSHATAGMGRNPVVMPFAMTTVGGVGAWVMSRADTARGSAFMMGEQLLERPALSEGFQEGFCRFLALEVAQALKLSLVFTDDEVAGRCYCIDLQLQIEGHSCAGRIALDSALHEGWIALANEQSLSARLPPTFEVPARLRLGTLPISADQVRAAQAGDALVLPPGSWDPRHALGHATLLVGERPVAAVRLSESRAEIADLPLVELTGVQVESAPFMVPLSALHQASFAIPQLSRFAIRSGDEVIGHAEWLYLGELPCMQLV